jgi:hypothetical protein
LQRKIRRKKILATSLCVYVKFNGVQCGSPALRGKVFCYHHARVRNARHTNIVLPAFDSPAAVNYAMHALGQLVLNRKITVQECRAATYALRLASNALDMARKHNEDANAVTDVNRYVAAEISYGVPDADPVLDHQETELNWETCKLEVRNLTGEVKRRDFSRAASEEEDRASAPDERWKNGALAPCTDNLQAGLQPRSEPVEARLASPADQNESSFVSGRDLSRAASDQEIGALAPDVRWENGALAPCADAQPEGLQPRTSNPALAAAVEAAAQSELNAGKIRDLNLADTHIPETNLVADMPAPPPPPPKPPRPAPFVRRIDDDEPYLRPTGDAVTDYLNREAIKRRRMFG